MTVKNCPKCGSRTTVHDSRLTGDGDIRRRRHCTNAQCGHRFTTDEVNRDVEGGLPSPHVQKLRAMVKAIDAQVLSIEEYLDQLEGKHRLTQTESSTET